MAILGFDYGLARIGVAIAQNGEITPLLTLDATSDFWPEIIILCDKYDPQKLVVGLPRNLEGNDTKQTKLARQFARHLELKSHLPVDLQDEALSSVEAQKRLDPNLSLPKQKRQLDQIAAVIILEDYLREQA